ncbi:DUF6460 domain-containing protein [Allorhizobium borbori]|uniref:DUF6460 domain-containing protein n=1 Tax=Allorhizobium borbori TaxID=485907 RepID=A0A7W6K3P3_9HYPH|nr:DUF6460 domain-containing protein [Allorhizobium borbori]MBB4104636.1 hypothetical protein [Allorhizobium borbori]PZU20305.1 MAG: hypothetical protein DI589_18120 [Shinella sp.]
MRKFLIGLFKIALASLIAGVGLSFFGITAQSILAMIGMTPESLWLKATALVNWALPNIALGAIIVVPVWLVAYVFLPPRTGD